ncbi:MAG: replication factor C large subunit [Candidatus Methanofastidiosia archaeon]
MFTQEFTPKKFCDIHGQNKPIKEIMAWINTWPNNKKALLIYGNPGTGKTASIYVIKNEMKIDLIELNTSDIRNYDSISKIVGNAATSRPLFKSKKIILIDEVDNIKGKADFGGARALAKIIKITQNPIILIANDPYKISPSIKNICGIIRFNTLKPVSIKNNLEKIAKKAGINVTPEALETIARDSKGDMRAAINDLESLGKNVDISLIEKLSPRDKENSIFEGLSAIFKSRSTEARRIFYDVDKPPDEILLWIDENMPKIYSKKDIQKAYYYLSRADIFLGRVKRRQYYKLWSYAMDLMILGVAVSRREDITFVRYASPAYFTHMSRTKARRKLTKELLSKIGAKTHSSTYDAKAYLPLLIHACKQPQCGVEVSRYFNLKPEEIELLCPENTEQIVNLLKDKEKPRKKEEKKSSKKENTSRVQQASLFHFK